ncbi:MAG TPA: carboxypeptidase regulatory-like domain-containing protein [Candidatus Binatia bacterium]|nr:carboxypeptidase regulatory-like domain-containing protein [Candidatus Binatia bacterium]
MLWPASVLLLPLLGLAQTSGPAQASSSYKIAGVVVDSTNGQPLCAANVSIYGSENRELAWHVTTASDGRFLFSALPAGKYTLTGSAHGYRAQGFHQHGDYFIGIAIGPNLDSEHITFRLVADARIEGKMLDDSGEPVRQASVSLYLRNADSGRQLTRQLTSAATDDRGHYMFSHLSPGTYFVSVSARPWFAQYSNSSEAPSDPDDATRSAEERAQLDVAYPMTFYPSVEDSSGASAIVLRPGDRVTADITVRAVPAVHLRIRNGDASGSLSTAVRGFPRLSQRIFEGTLVPVGIAQASSASPNSYDYTGIAPGHYIVELPDSSRPGRAGWYQEMDLNGTVELDPSGSPPLVSVSGMLALEGNERRPPGQIYVVLANRATSETFVAEVKANGSFEFAESDIRPGSYDLVIQNAPGYQVKTLTAHGAHVHGQSIQIAASRIELAVTATNALARVSGVVLAGDQPHPGAMVVLVPRATGSSPTLFRRDQSDSDGTFTLLEVIPGSYLVIAIEDGWDLDWASPSVLQPFLKDAALVEVNGEMKLNVKVQLQR